MIIKGGGKETMNKLFEVTEENYTITVRATLISRDLLLEVTGGDHPHIGTVTTVSKDTAPETLRFPSHDGRFHKDDLLAQKIVQKIQPFLPGNCVITVGVHVDHISQAQIQVSSEMASQLGSQIAQWLAAQLFLEDEPLYYKKGEKPQ